MYTKNTHVNVQLHEHTYIIHNNIRRTLNYHQLKNKTIVLFGKAIKVLLNAYKPYL